MRGADFFDTNVLVYLFDARDARRSEIADALLASAQRDRTGIISFQVVQETLSVLTRKLKPTFSADQARQALDQVLLPLWTIHPTPALYQRALDVQGRYGFAFYDSLIVAAALEGGCTRLLSEDLQHGQQIDSLTIENPFLDEAS
ncbi:MAG: PilT protein domain protein [Hydrocarboniphaga sp.]|uniref:PIN domain-containing protein n=1 Tax=Hydrocarboniphaga sp. TaxID=2033016 RepID=UPI002620C736|nr:PIN domain-containing protein [Hydrocarboniphaga sp.]MDB5969316.1 PilT protein domain protein [Hydrocarboniphaga sp.]